MDALERMRDLVGGDAREQGPGPSGRSALPITEASVAQLHTLKGWGSRVAFAVLTLIALSALLDWVWS